MTAEGTNSLGAVVVFDGGNPRTFTGRVKSNVLAGQLVRVDTATGVVGSGADTFETNDLLVQPIADSLRVNGIALKTVSSGTDNYVPVARRGDYLMRTSAVISGGALIGAVSGTLQSVANAAIVSGGGGVYNFSVAPIGRAMANSASGTAEYNLVSLNL